MVESLQRTTEGVGATVSRTVSVRQVPKPASGCVHRGRAQLFQGKDHACDVVCKECRFEALGVVATLSHLFETLTEQDPADFATSDQTFEGDCGH